jgi:transcriptional regulator with XRE-family HTH domain
VKQSITKQLSTQVKFLRSKHKLTQEMLAHRSGISLKYIQKIEGKTPPNVGLETSEKLAVGFGIPLWKLFKFEPKNENKDLDSSN